MTGGISDQSNLQILILKCCCRHETGALCGGRTGFKTVIFPQKSGLREAFQTSLLFAGEHG